MNTASLRRARGAWMIAIALGVGSIAGSAYAQDAAPITPWSVGRTWMFVRAGYAGSNAEASGHGGAGYGFGFSHILSPSRVDQWSVFGVRPLGFLHWTVFKDFSLGASTHYDVVSRFGSASEIDIPVTLDAARHFHSKSDLNPYLGFGGGWTYRKSYQTGDDYGHVVPAFYLAGGFNLPIAHRQLLGVDLRLTFLDGENVPPNPVFGNGESGAMHISGKLNYAFID